MLDPLAFELRKEQVPGYTNLVTQKRHLLRFLMGTGKTVVGTKAAYDIGAKRILIICPSNAIRVWEDHIKKWYDGLDAKLGKDTSFNIHRVRKKNNDTQYRKAIFTAFDRGADVNIQITTGGAFLKDYELHYAFKPDLVIVDEAKRLGVMNRKTKMCERLKPLLKDPKVYFWPMTGTPGYEPQHLWSCFNLFDPKYFSSFWKFVDVFHYVIDGFQGRKEIVGIKNKDEWYRLLNAKTTYLDKTMLGHQETQRSVLHVEMDEYQARLYKQMQDDMVAITDSGELLVAQTSLVQTIRYRQLLCCPKILDPSASIGGAFADLVANLKEEDADAHTVIFAPFTDAFPHFAQYLRDNGFSSVNILSGRESLSPDELQARIDVFRKERGIILCSILYATAFSLEPAKACYFVGFDYNGDNNAQAEERINRLTTPHLCNAYYYCYDGTYDEELFDIVNIKHRKRNETFNLGSKEVMTSDQEFTVDWSDQNEPKNAP